MTSVRSIESILTLIAIDTLRIVLAILTQTATLVVAVNVKRQSLLVHVLIVNTLRRMIETVARLTLKRSSIRVLSPLFLHKARATFSALNSARVVLALTGQHAIRCRLQDIAGISVTIAHASTADGDVTDRVEVLHIETTARQNNQTLKNVYVHHLPVV